MFRALDETGLLALDDDALIEYLRGARSCGHPSTRTALSVLVYGHWDNIVRRVRMKVPPAAVEDVAAEVLTSAFSAAFDGDTPGEFHVWLRTITARRIADFHRRRADAAVALEDVVLVAPDESSVEVEDAVERVLAGYNDLHRWVVEKVVLQGVPATALDGVSSANAHQIASRFRRALREELSIR